MPPAQTVVAEDATLIKGAKTPFTVIVTKFEDEIVEQPEGINLTKTTSLFDGE